MNRRKFMMSSIAAVLTACGAKMSGRTISPDEYPVVKRDNDERRFYMPRFRNFVAKFLNTQRDYSLETLTDEIQPVIVVPDDIENMILRQEMLYRRGFAIAAGGVGQFSLGSLTLPGTADVLAIPDEIVMSTGVTGEWIAYLVLDDATVQGPITLSVPTDVRNVRGSLDAPETPSRCQIGFTNSTATDPSVLAGNRIIMQRFVLANTPIVFRPRVILAPEVNIQGETGVANVALIVGFRTPQTAIDVEFAWRERIGSEQEMSQVR